MTPQQNDEQTAQTATSRENGFRDFSGGGERVMRLNQVRIIKRNQSVPSEIAERAGSYSAQHEAYEPRVALAMASAASQKVRVRVGKLPYGEQFADQVVSQTLANAEFLFTHWVWVAGVEPNAGTDSNNRPVDKVDFTYSYTGNSLFDLPQGQRTEDGVNYWPTHDGSASTQLPWTTGFSWITEGEKVRSSTEMVWKWKNYDFSKKWDATNNKWAYSYDWNPTSPSIYTRYFDGSP